MKAILNTRNIKINLRISFEKGKEIPKHISHLLTGLQSSSANTFISKDLFNFSYLKKKMFMMPSFQNLSNELFSKNKNNYHYAFENRNQINHQNFDKSFNSSIFKFSEEKNNMNDNNKNFEKKNLDINLSSEHKNENDGKFL